MISPGFGFTMTEDNAQGTPSSILYQHEYTTHQGISYLSISTTTPLPVLVHNQTWTRFHSGFQLLETKRSS